MLTSVCIPESPLPYCSEVAGLACLHRSGESRCLRWTLTAHGMASLSALAGLVDLMGVQRCGLCGCFVMGDDFLENTI